MKSGKSAIPSGAAILYQRIVQAREYLSLGLGRTDDLRAEWLYDAQYTVGVRLAGQWVSMLKLGRRHPGFGMDPDCRLSARKALMEALESLAIDDASLKVGSRTGIAANPELEAAKASAHAELVERDAFLRHWLTGFPALRLLGEVRHRGLSAPVVELQSADPRLSVALAASVNPRSGCWWIGLGAAGSSEKAMAEERARREWLATVLQHDLCGGDCPGGAGSASPRRRQIQEHHLHSSQPEISARMNRIMKVPAPDSAVDDRCSRPPDHDFAHSGTKWDLLQTRSRRYRVVRAENPHLLPLEFGRAFAENRDRYESLLRKRGLQMAEPFLPHPFD